jgi:hypothetical protein
MMVPGQNGLRFTHKWRSNCLGFDSSENLIFLLETKLQQYEGNDQRILKRRNYSNVGT